MADPKHVRMGITGVVSAAALVGLYFTYDAMYARPMGSARARLMTAQAAVDELNDKLRDERGIRKEIKEASKKTLGYKQDQVEHRFSAGLRKLAERNGMTRVVVTQKDFEKAPNPLTRSVGMRPDSVKKALVKAPDFWILKGSVRGTGNFDQVLKAMAEIDAQPWVRIESFQLHPLSKEADQFSLDLEVAAPWVRDWLNEELPDQELLEERPQVGWQRRAIVARNAFRDAPPEVMASAPPIVVKPVDAPANNGGGTAPPAPLPPPPPPWSEWLLTGVVIGRTTGVQAFLSNTRTSQTMTVLKGGRVEDAILVDGQGESATFEIGGQRFTVKINQTLADRKP